uniref:Nose resistant to fluoxetine protein 6-like n=1 Tax=Crassostrea virginica TaxID=6565 RepID=A0A8B8D6H4_CRAVI|nr:nose resistant to fluoxetine protein 6-like [Crassostrea virginica]
MSYVQYLCLIFCISFTVSLSVAQRHKPYFEVIEEAVQLTKSKGERLNKWQYVQTSSAWSEISRNLFNGVEVGASATTYNVSEQCSYSLSAVLLGLSSRQNWALQIIDATGKPEAGILDGSLRWLGSYDECKRISYHNETMALSIKGKYSILQIPFGTSANALSGSSTVSLLIGLCLPDSCSASDAYAVVHNNIGRIPIGDFSNLTFNIIPETTDKPLTTNAIVTIVILSILAFILILGTTYDVIIVHWLRKKEAPEKPYIDPTIKTSDGEKIPLLNHNSHDVHTDESTFEKLLLSFSAYSNGLKILSTRRSSETLGALNGIRFLSISWVVLGHSYAFVVSTISNSGPFLKEMLGRRSFQAIANALVSVDSFFALSGFLLAYLTFKEMEKRDGKINWIMFYFHRFWRLTPAYMLVLMTEATLSPYFADGPIYPPNGFEVDYCEDSWWRNLLYINNLVDTDKICMGWSWYLSNDMQFFILSPLMLIPLYYHEVAGILVCSVFLLGTTIAPGVISSHYDMPPSLFSTSGSAQGFLEYFNKYYIKPWCRMGPYIIGILSGYLLYKTKSKLRINRVLNLLIWAVTATSACLVLYGLYDSMDGNPLSTGVSALYNATNRTVWGACVCWVIFACATGNGGPVNTLLSWSPFGPLAKLSYCVYLVHPVIMYANYYSQRTSIYLDDFSAIYLFLGNLVLSYMVAFVTSLAFEAPMMGLEKVLLRKERK